jgi:hypothetical protein
MGIHLLTMALLDPFGIFFLFRLFRQTHGAFADKIYRVPHKPIMLQRLFG